MSSTNSWLQSRGAGVLLHITSLPGSHDRGDLGPDAHRFVDFLAEAGFSVWQTLPVGPVHNDLSPYGAQSSFAGHTGLLSPELLYEEGLLNEPPGFGHEELDRMKLIDRAWEVFRRDAGRRQWDDYEDFLNTHSDWLSDYSLFRVLRRLHGDQPWYQWPLELRRREESALEKVRRNRPGELACECFGQFLFFDQWARLCAHAERRGIELFGDLPIYVAHDSADVWSHKEYFTVDADGRRLALAGVPPDAFSDTGQLWGNPLYHWERLAADGHRWWIERFRIQTALFHMLRVDHFRGFTACWEIPSDAPSAQQGRWVRGPGRALFDAVSAELGPLRLVAEDLGEITPEVNQVRESLGFPGMRVLQFAFDGGTDNPHRHEHHRPDTVVYTGTHDNDTTLGWWHSLAPGRQEAVLDYLGRPSEAMPRPLVRDALASPGRLAVIPMQDLMGLDSQARMNTPGHSRGNWRWRFQWEDLPPGLAADSRELLRENERLKGSGDEK